MRTNELDALSSALHICSLNDIPEELYARAGGKAKGLFDLAERGLQTPRGFVVIGAKQDADFEEIADYYEANGYGAVAVRSSASNEDGVDFSNAGQYSSYLNVTGRDAFVQSLKKCLLSLENTEAQSYASSFSQAKSDEMAIVVQDMVDAKAAGVCFTMDPVNNTKNILVEAVPGLGDALVSGEANALQYVITRENGHASPDAITKALNEANNESLIPEETLIRLVRDAERAEKYFECALDLEWAIDKQGNLFWLQARPITTLDEATLDELDGYSDDKSVFTTCNIGEMLPGAITPLSLSTTIRGIDRGLGEMLVCAGVFKNIDCVAPTKCITHFNNHLFFNLSTVFLMEHCVVGAKKKFIEQSICGMETDTPAPDVAPRNGFVCMINGLKYFRFVTSSKKARKRIDQLCERFYIPDADDYGDYYKNIDDALPDLNYSLLLHYMTSAESGAMSSALLEIIKAGNPKEDAIAIRASLFDDIEGIESVDILRSMRRLVREILAVYPNAETFSNEDLAHTIKSDNGAIRSAYDAFIARHGHRAIREAELRSRSWKYDEPGLMEHLKTIMLTGGKEEERESGAEALIDAFMADKKGILKAVIKFVLTRARAGVANREYTKSRFIKITDEFKIAYDRLAAMLVGAGILPEKDLIYFLTHPEIGDLIFRKKTSLLKRAVQRRRLLDEQMQMKFERIYVGKPKPIEINLSDLAEGETMNGLPISKGVVTGKARVVKTIDDAKRLQKGEIMVSEYTDIGWSPYYSLVGGLITEVGSILSHGAVVAREYALPLVVGVQGATMRIRTGDTVLLNATKGEIVIVEKGA